MAEATTRSSAPDWREAFDGQLHAWIEASVGRFACGMFRTNGAPATSRARARCLECLALVGISVSIDLGADRALPREARLFSDSSERTAAAATVIDLVIADLRGHPGDGVVAIAELYEIRASLHDIAGKLRQASIRWDR